MSDPLPELSEAQMEIMGVVWDRGEATVADVWKVLSSRRRVARSTVVTMLTRLQEKGWLSCDDDGHAFRYRATQPRATTLNTIVSKLVDTAFGGSAENLVMALLHGRGVSKAEAAEIRRMIDRAEGRKS
ncbi:BlaI/MecI/CopY family transcriptional regulator [Paludisphaera rhizosphaerae]|uniref:BlaI/MecI/CopY family transcriptional regulator n=1 Tax=Paludisphaera rhizosphaerae TaxID=2711216 RepID=UPI0013ECB05A|nr:BlaI/MecI/CopY family transcriptional regulator [Paludisphaera rhizosphaerae]